MQLRKTFILTDVRKDPYLSRAYLKQAKPQGQSAAKS